MASIHEDKKGYRIVFYDVNKERKQLRFGKLTKKQVNVIFSRIESIVSAQSAGSASFDQETARWLAKIPASLHERLSRVGLVPKRESATIGAFISEYCGKRTDVKPSTQLKWKSARTHLINFFGADKPLRDITAGDADEFRLYLLGRKNAENSVRRYCGLAKQFFGAALKKKLIEENPFSGVVAAVTGNDSKYYYLSKGDSEKVLDACPDLQWKLIFSLARFGGLRCPSEILLLKWTDINWETNRILITSRKTEHHKGKETRFIPLFPELRSLLEEGFSQAEDGAVFVITRYREPTQNLRTTFRKIIQRAGLNVWVKLFQNLRSTRQTELCEIFPSHVVSAWIGNSETVANRHYLQVTDGHFEKASAILPREQGETLVAMTTPDKKRTVVTRNKEARQKTSVFRGLSSEFTTRHSVLMGAEGPESISTSPDPSPLCHIGGNAGGNNGASEQSLILAGIFNLLSSEKRQELVEFAKSLTE